MRCCMVYAYNGVLVDGSIVHVIYSIYMINMVPSWTQEIAVIYGMSGIWERIHGRGTMPTADNRNDPHDHIAIPRIFAGRE